MLHRARTDRSATAVYLTTLNRVINELLSHGRRSVSDRVRLINSTPDTARTPREIYPEIGLLYIQLRGLAGSLRMIHEDLCTDLATCTRTILVLTIMMHHSQ